MINKVFKILYLILIISFVFLYFMAKELPPRYEVDNSLLNEPVQTETNREEFSFNYKEKNYEVVPKADYSLRGLVVSKNNVNAWFNYYHDENSVNLKDLCVIWGENINSKVYLNESIKFKNGEWTCYWSWDTKLSAKFYPEKLSNNHLLSDNEEIRKIINKVNIGDQIFLKGSLVDYREEGTKEYRMTSIDRDDDRNTSRSGGGCEVFFIDDINILSQNNFYMYFAKDFIKYLFFFLIVLNIFINITIFKIRKR